MDVIKSDVRKLVNKELNAANKRLRPFASPHEGQNIVREETGRGGAGPCTAETPH